MPGADMTNIPINATRIERTLVGVMMKAGLSDLRCQAADLPGTPDAVSDSSKVACFGHGCFWHHHQGCRLGRLPSTNTAFWSAKFERNRIRDRAAVQALRTSGWRVITLWECADRDVRADELQKCFDLVLRLGLRRTEITANANRDGSCVILCK